MAQIIDNVKVGTFIKSLLKEKHMTQDQLAENLHITKAAVSQNLNGKSTFDIQNLLKIAELFQLTLDDLVAGRRPEDLQDIDSEYVRMIKRGLKHFQQHDPQQFHLTQPDVYGKLFIDYLLADKLNDWIKYLVEKQIKFVDINYHRHQPLLQQLLLYVMQHQLTSPLPLIEQCVQTYGELRFTSSMDLDTFMHLLEQDTTSDLATRLLTNKTVYTQKRYIFGLTFQSKMNHYWMHRPLFIEHVIGHRQLRLWKLVIQEVILPLSFSAYETYFKRLVKAGFVTGLVAMIDAVKPLPYYEVYPSQDVLNALVLLIKENQVKTVDLAIEKNLVDNLNELCESLLSAAHLDYVDHLIKDYPSKLKSKRLIKAIIASNAWILVEHHPGLFNEDVLSYGLDAMPLTQATKDTLTKLIKFGAKFKPENYNRFTTEKMNRLVIKTKKGTTNHVA
jgi:transcriptional regulator with XRE-family HTH domain